MKYIWYVSLLFVIPAFQCIAQEAAPFHRAEEDREIIYWLLDPSTHQFRFSHDFNIFRKNVTEGARRLRYSVPGTRIPKVSRVSLGTRDTCGPIVGGRVRR